jgi:hypothetical protein
MVKFPDFPPCLPIQVNRLVPAEGREANMDKTAQKRGAPFNPWWVGGCRRREAAETSEVRDLEAIPMATIEGVAKSTTKEQLWPTTSTVQHVASVADPDPGSEVFFTLGSSIRIRDRKKLKSVSGIWDEHP